MTKYNKTYHIVDESQRYKAMQDLMCLVTLLYSPKVKSMTVTAKGSTRKRVFTITVCRGKNG